MKRFFSIALGLFFVASLLLASCKSGKAGSSPYRGKSGKSKRKSKCNCPGYTFEFPVSAQSPDHQRMV